MLEELLLGFESGLDTVSVALFVKVPAPVVWTVRVIVSRSPAGKSPRLQTTVEVPVQLPLLEVAPSSVTPLGSTSVTEAPSAGFCPEFTPMLPIQRCSASGANVPCWYTCGVAFGRRISYQRMPACFAVSPTLTVWLATIDSWSPKLR